MDTSTPSDKGPFHFMTYVLFKAELFHTLDKETRQNAVLYLTEKKVKPRDHQNIWN